MSVTQSSHGSASGYEVVHRVLAAVFAPGFRRISVVGDVNAGPGIVSIPLACFLGWLGSVTGRQPSHPARFARIQVPALTRVDAERGRQAGTGNQHGRPVAQR